MCGVEGRGILASCLRIMSKSDSPLSLREVIDMEFKEDPSLIGEGLLPTNGLMFLIGPPKTYKSFIMGSIVAHLATGTNLFGAHRIEHGRPQIAFPVTRKSIVLMIEQEIGWYDLQLRYGEMHRSSEPQHQETLGKNIFFSSCDRDLRLDTDIGLGKMSKLIESCGAEVLALDPLIKFHGADENSAQEMSAVFRNLDRLRDRHGLAVLINHHARRESGVGQPAEGGRGSTAIFAEGDSFLQVSTSNRNAGIVVLNPIIRRGKPIRPFQVALDFTTLKASFKEWGKGKVKHGRQLHEESD